MKTLTQSQAALVRKHRPATQQIEKLLEDIPLDFSDACDHESYERDCPMCLLWSRFHKAKDVFAKLCIQMDQELLAGPDPNGRPHDLPS